MSGYGAANGARRNPPDERHEEVYGVTAGRVPPHSLDAEASVLGCVLLQPAVLPQVVETGLEATDLYQPAHRVIFEAMLALDARGVAIDVLTVGEECRRATRPIQGIEAQLSDLAARVPTAANVGYYVGIVREHALRRRMIAATGEIQSKAYDIRSDTDEFVDEAEARIYDVTRRRERQSYVHVKTLGPKVVENAQARYDQNREVTGVPCGLIDVDRLTTGFQPQDLILLAGRPSAGKAQPDDALVLTENGTWKRMGDLRLGEALASIDGAPSVVEGVYPQGKKQVYRVTFADGRSAECCDEHLWRVYYRTWPEPRVLSLAELRRLLSKKRYQGRVWIDTFSGEFGHGDKLPLDPWVLGVLLGDGCLTGSSVRFSSADTEVVGRVAQRLWNTSVVKHVGKYDYRILTSGGRNRRGVCGVVPNEIKVALEQLGLWSLCSDGKFIPPSYLSAKRSARLNLLRGLLDTDGTVDHRSGSISFCTISERLRDDVVSLARSLGATVGVSSKRPTYRHANEVRQGAVAYTITISYSDPKDLFTLRRKTRLTKPRQHLQRLNVTSIEPTRITETRCIKVSHPQQLYITNEYVVTHNTALALHTVLHAAHQGIPCLIFSLEMSRNALMERLACNEGMLDGQQLRTGRLSKATWPELVQALARLSELPIFIDDSGDLSPVEIRAKARRWRSDNTVPHREDGQALIVIDYLQLVSVESSFSRNESREQQVARVGRSQKNLAKELEVPVIALCQLSRRVEKGGSRGGRPQLSDLRESGSLEQDADVVVFVHRPQPRKKKGKDDDKQLTLTPEQEERKSEVIIGKQRNGPTGVVEVLFRKESSRFESISPREEDESR